MLSGRLNDIFISPLNDPYSTSVMILFSIQWGETKFGEFTKHIFNFVIEGVWCAVLIDDGHIKIPFSKYVPIVDNMSNVDEIHFSNLLAIGIYGPLVRISISLLVLVRARVLSFSNPIEVRNSMLPVCMRNTMKGRLLDKAGRVLNNSHCVPGIL